MLIRKTVEASTLKSEVIQISSLPPLIFILTLKLPTNMINKEVRHMEMVTEPKKL